MTIETDFTGEEDHLVTLPKNTIFHDPIAQSDNNRLVARPGKAVSGTEAKKPRTTRKASANKASRIQTVIEDLANIRRSDTQRLDAVEASGPGGLV